MLTLYEKTYNNWKEYFDDKFSDKSLFIVEQFDKDNKNIYSYRITSTNENCKTEIIVQLFIDNDFAEVFDIHFNHPDSPIWTTENKKNNYGWDGQGCSFTLKDLIDSDDWINVPIFHGWTETTFYFDNVEVKTEVYWYPMENGTIPISQIYLNNFGCLTFPIVPFVIWYKSWLWKNHPERMKTIERKIPAMIERIKSDG